MEISKILLIASKYWNRKIEIHKSIVRLPYINNLSDGIKKFFCKHILETVSRISSKTPQLLPSPKDNLNPFSSKGKDNIQSACGLTYIGEAGSSVIFRCCQTST